MGTRISRRRRTFLQSGLAAVPALAASLLRAQSGAQQAQGGQKASTPASSASPWDQPATQSASGDEAPEKRLPSGQTQTEAILKADYEQNVKDARELTALAKSIELDLDKNDENVLSLSLLKKLDDVETISKRMRVRMRR